MANDGSKALKTYRQASSSSEPSAQGPDEMEKSRLAYVPEKGGLRPTKVQWKAMMAQRAKDIAARTADPQKGNLNASDQGF